jgi:hypothetical protein
MNRTVIYTAIFGDKDTLLEPRFIPPGCDFICFTDSDDFKSPVWQIRKGEPVSNDPVRNARFYKVMPHRFLSEYEYSVWVDGNILVRGDVNKLIEKYLAKVNIACFNHAENKADPRNSVYEEAEALVKMAARGKFKDDPEVIKKQMEAYKAAGFPDNNGLIVSMEMIRRHNEGDVIKSMEDWWNEIKNYSRRDQLSFNYIAWKNKLNFVYINGDSRDNEYFLWLPHKNKKYWDSPK